TICKGKEGSVTKLNLRLLNILINSITIPTSIELCLASLSSQSVNCQEILKGDFLVNIADDLKQPLVGNEIQRNAIQKKQETDCEILYAILNDREDNEARQSSIDVGIVIELIKIFNSRKFSLVTEPYANVFMSLSGPANDLIKGQIVAMKVYQALIHMLDTVNMTEVMNSTMLNIITKDLSKPLVGSDQEVNDISQRQEKLCLFLISILKLLKDQTIMRLLINCGVSQALTDIFKYRELNQITQTFSSTFDQIVITAEIDSRKLIYEKKPFEGLTKLLTHQNEQIVSDALNSYLNIIIAGSKTSNEQLPHPYLNEIIQCGGIQAINSIFQNTKQNKDMKDKSAIIIGRLYRAKQLEDQMKKYIIDHLKTLLCDPNIQTMKDGKEAIIDLGQNQGILFEEYE
ncbi:MAG: hypothetical protein EZS28_020833, partial [Streblomastix strix]